MPSLWSLGHSEWTERYRLVSDTDRVPGRYSETPPQCALNSQGHRPIQWVENGSTFYSHWWRTWKGDGQQVQTSAECLPQAYTKAWIGWKRGLFLKGSLLGESFGGWCISITSLEWGEGHVLSHLNEKGSSRESQEGLTWVLGVKAHKTWVRVCSCSRLRWHSWEKRAALEASTELHGCRRQAKKHRHVSHGPHVCSEGSLSGRATWCVCPVTQSCLTLCNPMDCSPPGSSVHGISPR